MPTGPNGERRPMDPVARAVTIGRIATGEAEDERVNPGQSARGTERAALPRQRAERRGEIAKAAATLAILTLLFLSGLALAQTDVSRAWQPLKRHDVAHIHNIQLDGNIVKPDTAHAIGRPLQIGVGRDLPSRHQGNILSRLAWHLEGSEQTAVFKVTSAGAASIRLAFAGHLPKQAKVRFFDMKEKFPSYPALARLPKTSASRASGAVSLVSPPLSTQKPTWSPIIAGEVVGIEITLPLSVAPEDYALSIEKVSHIFPTNERDDPGNDGRYYQPANEGSACPNEPVSVACATAPEAKDLVTDSAVRIDYNNDNGDVFTCSAALIEDGRPEAERRENSYLLTAAHCVMSESVADTVEVTFGHQAETCDGSVSPGKTIARGTDVMAVHQRTDHSILRLDSALPSDVDVGWLAWVSADNYEQRQMLGAHHPGGGAKEYMVGTLTNNRVNVYSEGTVMPVQALRVHVESGHVRGGSSGSAGVINAQDKIAGALSGVSNGDGQCLAFYGRMDDFENYAGALLRAETTNAIVPVEDDYPNQISDATGVLPNSSLEGKISHDNDIDVFSITLTRPGRLRVWAESAIDTIALLRDCNGDPVSDLIEDDDAGFSANFEIEENLTSDDCSTWYIEVTSFDGGIGSYQLHTEFTLASASAAHGGARAYAIPPVGVQDDSSVRIRCDSKRNACDVRLACADQAGAPLSGRIDGIAPQTIHVATSDRIGEILGVTSWSRRLACEMQSEEPVSVQIWTRSGNGVLINNSAIQDSIEIGDKHILQARSIPSTTTSDDTNFRIRCESRNTCEDMAFVCHTDAGRRFSGTFEDIPAGAVRHMQADTLETIIGHQWPGMTLSCEIESSERTSLQVLTRTGNGTGVNRPLVNNTIINATDGGTITATAQAQRARHKYHVAEKSRQH